ncbi:MAG TPA: B12-binding domain-containing protein [Longilinea sp.]|nr:B12-binding domain-containing protein [Longilinea sp.]
MDEQAPAYNLKAVIKETGLTPATLRAWERRYGIFKPQRSPGGHRLYSENEIILLKWLVERQKEGLSISRAVDLWRWQATQSPSQVTIPPVSQMMPAIGEGMLGQLRQSWCKACLDFNEPEAELAMAKALAIAAPETVCAQVLQKGLAELGRGWYAGKVSVQQEHFAAALVARRLNALFAIAPMPSRPGRLLAACPPGEDHDLALLMLAFILRWQGWDVIYLGADVPLDRLDSTLRATAAQMVLSAAQTLPGAASLLELAEFVNSRSIPLAYGGGIFNEISELSDLIPAHFLGQNVDIAPQVIERLLTYRPSAPVAGPLPPSYKDALGGFKEYEALIVTRVRQIMQSSQVAQRHVESANMNFCRAVTAALSLGDIHLLDHSIGWLNGLLENCGVLPVFALQYYQAFRQAVREQTGFQSGLLLTWLDRFETVS